MSVQSNLTTLFSALKFVLIFYTASFCGNSLVAKPERTLWKVVRMWLWQQLSLLNKKEAVILGIELTTLTAASFFAPGVDIGYFFIKGAILRKKHPNWFKAGVSNAYDNSICWFWLKGKPINLNVEDEIKVKEIKTEKAEKLIAAIDKRNQKEEIKTAKKIESKNKKETKKQIKEEKKRLKQEVKEAKRLEKLKQEEELELEDEFEYELEDELIEKLKNETEYVIIF